MSDYREVDLACLRKFLADPGPEFGPVDVPDHVADLVVDCDREGACVDFAFLKRPPGRESDYELHKAAAERSMTLFAERNDCYFKGFVDLGIPRGLKAKELVAELRFLERIRAGDHFSTHMTPEQMKGELVSVPEFLGEGYDLESKYFDRDALGFKGPENVNAGLVYAFCLPPHGGPSVELLERVLDRIFNWFSGGATIYRWNDAWSNYFDAGKEWWGTFFWTVHLHANDIIVGVGASTTD